MSAPMSFEQAPPLSVPQRFFLTAPLFGIAAGLTLAVHWDAVTASRWAPQTAAVVHLLTVGFMLQVMAGALLQVMPVAAGANVWRPRLVAGVVHPALVLGAISLAAGFLGLGAPGLQAAAVLLGSAVVLYAAVALVGLVRSPAIGPTVMVLRTAVVGLVVAAGLGVSLAALFGWGLPLPFVELLHLHVAWAVLGWALMLLMGVAYLVVPMFQLTPAYPVAIARALPSLLVAGLAAWTAGIWFHVEWLEWLGAVLGAAGVSGFAWQTLRLQAQRRRKVVDSTLRYWRLAMACLLGAVAVELSLRFVAASSALRPHLELLAGVLLFGGAFPSAINGMLYKVVGFLGWLHLQRVSKKPPTMQQVMPEAGARWHLRLFVSALALLLGAAGWAPLAIPGGLLFAAACALLEWHLVGATRRYLRLHAEATRAVPAIPAPD